MPIRYINVPDAVTFKEPFTGETLKTNDGKAEELSFEGFLQKLMHNPMWGETFTNMKAQSVIMTEWERCKAAGDHVMVLAEEEWSKLKAVSETPRYEILTPMGSQIRQGYGVHPSLALQLVPLVTAIVDASTNDPRAKAKA